MRYGLTLKFFLALIALSVLVALGMGVAARYNFTRGFLGYLNEQGIERVESLVPGVTQAYRVNGSWDFLRANPRAWFELTRPVREASRRSEGLQAPALPDSDLTGVMLRVALLDEQRRVLAGNANVGSDAATRPIVVDDRTVGWLAVVPFQQVTSRADLRFQSNQLRTTWVIGAVSVMLAALLAIWLTQRLLGPIKRIGNATHRLAAGDYTARAQVTSQDEIGRLAADFNRLAQTLEKNERIRRAFVADISHELRTPLAILRGELEAMEDGVRTLSPESLKSLQSEVGMLTKLVNDLYELSLSDVGALNYRMADTDIVETLQLALGAYAQRFAERRLTVTTDLPQASLVIQADEDRLRQLLNNLLENTLRYTDPGGRIEVSCQRAGNEARIILQDSAPGVPEALLPRLFERFYRVEGSRNRATGGAGLGLAICSNIIHAHGGRIEAHHSPLGGLRVVITLPIEGPARS